MLMRRNLNEVSAVWQVAGPTIRVMMTWSPSSVKDVRADRVAVSFLRSTVSDEQNKEKWLWHDISLIRIPALSISSTVTEYLSV